MRPATKHAWVLAVLCACGAGAADGPVRRVGVAELRAMGLSGTATDDEGRLWAVTEREEALYRFEDAERDASEVLRVPIDGVPGGVDLEAVAWIGPGRIALGTEAHAARDEDLVLFAQLVPGGRARVTSFIRLDWQRLFGLRAPHNQGIEGLCHAGGALLAGGEPVIVERGQRFAPLVRLDTDAAGRHRWVPFRVALSSASGKLASLDCTITEDGDAMDVFGIERHYGVTRVLRFHVPLRGHGGDLEAEVIADLSEVLDRMPNMEGLSRRGGRLVIISDHDSVDLEGTTEAIMLGPLDD